MPWWTQRCTRSCKHSWCWMPLPCSPPEGQPMTATKWWYHQKVGCRWLAVCAWTQMSWQKKSWRLKEIDWSMQFAFGEHSWAYLNLTFITHSISWNSCNLFTLDGTTARKSQSNSRLPVSSCLALAHAAGGPNNSIKSERESLRKIRWRDLSFQQDSGLGWLFVHVAVFAK